MDIDLAAVLVKLNHAVNECEKREIAAAANIAARMDLRSALADNNAASSDQLSAKGLYA